MLRLPLLNLQCRETNRLPAAEINQKLGCGGVHGGSYLPLELQQVPQVSDGKFVVYYGSDYYGELPPNHNRPIFRSKATFILVKVDGCREHVIDEGEVENDLKIHGINTAGTRPWSHFIAKGKVLGRFSFYCTSPENNGASPTPPVLKHSGSVVDDGFRGLIDQLAGHRK
jgi:hypothetical protein